MIISSATIQMSDLPDCRFKQELSHIVIAKHDQIRLNAVVVQQEDGTWVCRIGYPMDVKHVTHIARARCARTNLPIDVSDHGEIVEEKVARHIFPFMVQFPYGG